MEENKFNFSFRNLARYYGYTNPAVNKFTPRDPYVTVAERWS